MRRLWFTYALGVAAGAAAGFLSPFWYLGFVPVSAGLLYAFYDLVDVEVPDGDVPSDPQRRRAT